MAAPPTKDHPESLECTFCRRSFVRPKSFLVHMCAKKLKWLNRDERYVKLGFRVFQRFHEVNYRRTPPNYDKFMESPFYTAFTRFGRYLLHINAIHPEAFIDFIIKAGLKIDRWDDPVVYETYIRDLNKRETASAAAERNILLMQQWATETGELWQDFFRRITPAQATHYIRSGRVSPWVLYTADSADQMFDRLSEEQINLVKEYVDPRFWTVMLDRNAEDVAFLKNIWQEAGV